MEFGEWVQCIRRKKTLDIHTFSEKTGVDASTISRIENLRTQATLYTAFHICEGLHIALAELIKELIGRYPSSFNKKDFIKVKHLLKLHDIEQRIEDFRANEGKVCEDLVKKLNAISLMAPYKKETTQLASNKRTSFHSTDIDKILFSSPLHNFLELKYPTHIAPAAILSVYEQGGALIQQDISAYLKHMRFDKNAVLKMQDSPIAKAPQTFLSRLEASSLERIKLIEILTLEELSDEDGRIMGMYWEVCKLHEAFNQTKYNNGHNEQSARFSVPTSIIKREDWEFKLASIYIIIYRWYQYLRVSQTQQYICDSMRPDCEAGISSTLFDI